jgi:ABC-type branched-subunit amino acid transport system ATPase component/predicted MFS family arabinose efflux permease
MTAIEVENQPETSRQEPQRSMPTSEVLRTGGYTLVITMFLLNFVDNFGANAVAFLGPDIQKTLGLSDTVLSVLNTLGGAMVLIGCVPAALLADRYARPKVIAVSSALLGVFTLLTGVVHTTWQLVVTRVGAGINKGNLPAFNSLLADAVPPQGRSRLFAIYGAGGSIAGLTTPVAVGAIASAAGKDGWRFAFVVISLPVIALGIVSWFIRDPGRGRFERAATLGLDTEDAAEEGPPPPVDEAIARLKRIKTYYFMTLALCAVGIGLFVVPTLQNLWLEKTLHVSTSERGVLGTLTGLGPLLGTVLAGVYGDKLYAQNPARVLQGCGLALVGMLFTAASVWTHSTTLYVVFTNLGGIPLFFIFVLLGVITAPVVPPKLRSMGFALTVVYLAVAGGLGGSILGGSLSDVYGPATAINVIIFLTVPAAAVLLHRAGSCVNDDIAAVARDLLDEEESRLRVLERPDGPLPGEALVEVRRLDFSYGQLQVLFDINVDVKQGEVLALLGTNGAGKSTLLRAVTGLGLPDRGVVRFAGDDVTYMEPSNRVKRGIVQVPGGKAIFPPLSVEENLRMGGFLLDDATYRERREEVLELFPVLRERLEQPAGSMSGGERQMLAIAKALLLRPRLLCIDELSLGLAPKVVEDLIGVVATLKERGVTMVLVEQSVNVALSLADRAIFMEKGHIRFEGPAAELLERGDLVRAVFLGGDAG